MILLIPDFEALPLALLEAMATGILPVVRAIKSGISEVVHHESKGFFVAMIQLRRLRRFCG